MWKGSTMFAQNLKQKYKTRGKAHNYYYQILMNRIGQVNKGLKKS